MHRLTNDNKCLDASQKLKYNTEGEVVFNFGKYNNQPVKAVLAKDKQYYNWILNKEISSQVKQLVKKLAKENENIA